jgi:hypothetical protein
VGACCGAPDAPNAGTAAVVDVAVGSEPIRSRVCCKISEMLLMTAGKKDLWMNEEIKDN